LASYGVRTRLKEYRPCCARRGCLAREIFFVNSRLREFGVRAPYREEASLLQIASQRSLLWPYKTEGACSGSEPRNPLQKRSADQSVCCSFLASYGPRTRSRKAASFSSPQPHLSHILY